MIQEISLDRFYASKQEVYDQELDGRYSPVPVYKCFFRFDIRYDGPPLQIEVLAPRTRDGLVHAFSWTNFTLEPGEGHGYNSWEDWIGLPIGKHWVHLAARDDQGKWWQLSENVPVWAGTEMEFPSLWTPDSPPPPPPPPPVPIPANAEIESVEQLADGRVRVVLLVAKAV